MTWQDRLRGNIEMVSPNGDIFRPLWVGNARTLEKKLGIFSYPKVRGSDVQDLEVNAATYPLTLYFEGDNNDIEATRFFSACESSTGSWSIVHPVKGLLFLQLVSVTEQIQPVESGNITQFDTEWIEPLDDNIIRSLAQLGFNIFSQGNIVNSLGIDQFFQNVVQNTFEQTTALVIATQQIVPIITNTLSILYESNSDLNSQIINIQQSILATTDEFPIDVKVLGGQLQNLIQLPLLASNDVQERFSPYSEVISQISALVDPEIPDIKTKNKIAAFEFALTASLVGIAQIDSTGKLASRPEALELVDQTAGLFDNVISTLDTAQAAYEDQLIEFQYYSESLVFPDLAKIIGQALGYLLQASFNLAIEKRFTIKKARAPIEITISEYGSLGDNDENFDLFISSNQLKGNQIYLLNAGTEVVVYV